MNNNRLLRVFLCHASQDKPDVRELNERLKSEDWLDPWLDEEKLSLGQDWKAVIEDTLDAADIVIMFLSKNSIQKEGFIQRESAYAWDISLKKPTNVIFLIPFRLDACEVPRHLQSRQWGDYFGEKKDKTYKILLRSLKERYEQILLIETKKRIEYEKEPDKQILISPSKEPSKESLLSTTNKKNILSNLLPDFRVRQRDYLLEISRALTQELDLEKLLARILRISIEMLTGQAGLIALKQPNGWSVATAHGIAPAFLSYLTPLLAEEKVRELDVLELNRMLKEMTYTASMGLLNGTGLPLSAHGQVIGVIFTFHNYADVFTPNDRVLLQAFADQAAIAVFNAILFKDATTNKD